MSSMPESANHTTKEDLAKLELRLGSRIGKLEATWDTISPHLATKEDLQKLKGWWLAGVIAGMVVAVTIALTILKLFF